MNRASPSEFTGVLAELTGQTESHLVAGDSRYPGQADIRIHREVAAPLQRLRAKARAAGFELAIASSFRDYHRQLHIWQEKVAGRRPIYAANGTLLAAETLSEDELLWAILRWSALPGTSRHHWGSDFDVYDAAAVAADYRLQLVPEEYTGDGPFAPFRRWLEGLIADGEAEGFYHPYAQDRGAVAPEPWHISYGPVADRYQSQFRYEVFEQLLRSGQWPLSAAITAHADDIYQRFVQIQRVKLQTEE